MAGRKKLFNGGSGLVHEDVFERRLMQGHRLDGTREGFHYFSNKSVTAIDFYANLPI